MRAGQWARAARVGPACRAGPQKLCARCTCSKVPSGRRDLRRSRRVSVRLSSRPAPDSASCSPTVTSQQHPYKSPCMKRTEKTARDDPFPCLATVDGPLSSASMNVKSPIFARPQCPQTPDCSSDSRMPSDETEDLCTPYVGPLIREQNLSLWPATGSDRAPQFSPIQNSPHTLEFSMDLISFVQTSSKQSHKTSRSGDKLRFPITPTRPTKKSF